jgi:hypothetical protein
MAAQRACEPEQSRAGSLELLWLSGMDLRPEWDGLVLLIGVSNRNKQN